uniref:von Willebrand factor A domain containing 5B2 n=1 Tax=Loxodonta africana TaxID=9785 RepID=G3TEY8_LOXAF
GHLVLDLAQARSTLVLPTGLIAAAGTMTVTLSSSRELPSRPDGVLRVALPSVLTPLAPPGLPGPPRLPGLCDDRAPRGFGIYCYPTLPTNGKRRTHDKIIQVMKWLFLLQKVGGGCCCSGLESPSHALRADAPPHASSAATICVTLAEGHCCDRALEILLYPSEPHQPHLMLEAGSLSSAEYEARVRARRDFQRLHRRDSDGDRQVWFLRRRFHKDILLNPVLVLSFCPDLSSKPGHLGTATRELLFLLDGSSAAHKARGDTAWQDAIVLAVKSLPPQTLINLAMFGTSVRPLFPESRPCSDDTVQLICESTEGLQAAGSPPDVLAALDWAVGQPQHRAHPRQLFLLTGASPPAAATHQTLELMRWYRGTARCFCFGLGSACHRLLQGLSALSRGQAYFLSPGERLQPLLVQALRKALEPALSDISVDWFVPDTTEALLTPREIPALYPGDRLLGYCSLFRVDGFRPRPSGHSREEIYGQEPSWQSLGGSVFPSPEEEPSATSPGTEPTGTTEPLGADTVSAEVSSPWVAGDSEQSTDALTDPGPNPSSDTAIWRRIFQSSYIREQYVLTHCSASPEPGPGSTGSSESPCSQGPGSPEGRAPPDPPSQQGCRSLAWVEPAGTRSCPLPAPPAASFKTRVPDIMRWLRNLLSPAPMDWDMLMEPAFLFTAVSPSGESAVAVPPQAPRCHVVIRGLCGEQPLCWEVDVGLEPPSPSERETAWDQALHRLTAASVIQDNEQLALRVEECFTGPARRSWLRALQTSKVSSAPSCFTCPVAVDATTREVLPGALQVWSSGVLTSMATLQGKPDPFSLVPAEPAQLPITPPASQGPPGAAPLLTVAHSKGNTQIWGKDPDQNGDSKSKADDPAGPTAGPRCLPPQPPSRLSLGRRRAMGFNSRRLCSPDRGQAWDTNPEGNDHDYLPLVRLQEAPGSFRLDAFCAAVHIPQERLCRASPFAVHRASFSPTSASSPCPSPSSCSEGPGQVDSGWGSDTEASEGAEGPGHADLRGRSWATAVALAWLEHRCTAAFGEWELAAAKADCWLQAQHLPDGLDVAALKAAARGLFLLLRHWDQNLQLHLLCYSPANM